MTHRILTLLFLARHAWPGYSNATLYSVVSEAVAAETREVPAELLIVIAQHESDFEPTAVSWRAHGKRVDLVWNVGRGRHPPNRALVCGLVQAMGRDRADCAAIIADLGGLTTGVRELTEWYQLCRGDLGCMARGHAGGYACARSRARCSRPARKISDHFARMTERFMFGR